LTRQSVADKPTNRPARGESAIGERSRRFNSNTGHHADQLCIDIDADMGLGSLAVFMMLRVT
jgi:hypothetical protein